MSASVEPLPVWPLDADDPFCTCPACGLLNNHGVEHRTLLPAPTVRVGRGLPFRDQKYGYGFDVTCDDHEDAPVAIRATRRECTFCGHAWYTHAQRQENPT